MTSCSPGRGGETRVPDRELKERPRRRQPGGTGPRTGPGRRRGCCPDGGRHPPGARSAPPGTVVSTEIHQAHQQVASRAQSGELNRKTRDNHKPRTPP